MPTLVSSTFALTELPVNYQTVKMVMQGNIFCEAAFIGTTSTHFPPTREKTWTRPGVEWFLPCDVLWKYSAHLTCIEPL